jgi:hypothetical protein
LKEVVMNKKYMVKLTADERERYERLGAIVKSGVRPEAGRGS